MKGKHSNLPWLSMGRWSQNYFLVLKLPTGFIVDQFFLLLLLVEYIFLSTFNGLYFNHQLHITITISSSSYMFMVTFFEQPYQPYPCVFEYWRLNKTLNPKKSNIWERESTLFGWVQGVMKTSAWRRQHRSSTTEVFYWSTSTTEVLLTFSSRPEYIHHVPEGLLNRTDRF